MTHWWLADLDVARRANRRMPFVSLPLAEISEWFQWAVPYCGPGQPIVDVAEVERRGYAACGDAAAALLAAADAKRLSSWLCVERPSSRRGYLHVRAIIDGQSWDPYSRFRPADLAPSCDERFP